MIETIKKKHPSVPVIAMTECGKEALAVAKEKRADVVISIPFDLRVLLKHIEGLLGDLPPHSKNERPSYTILRGKNGFNRAKS
jgi:hypothetical protein